MYEGLRSLLCDSMWSLTLPRVGRTSGAKKFGSSGRKDFFDRIGKTEKNSVRAHVFRFALELGHARRSRHVSNVPETEVAAYSITSSASASSDSGTSTPSAFAVLRLRLST